MWTADQTAKLMLANECFQGHGVFQHWFAKSREIKEGWFVYQATLCSIDGLYSLQVKGWLRGGVEGGAFYASMDFRASGETKGTRLHTSRPLFGIFTV